MRGKIRIYLVIGKRLVTKNEGKKVDYRAAIPHFKRPGRIKFFYCRRIYTDGVRVFNCKRIYFIMLILFLFNFKKAERFEVKNCIVFFFIVR